jgi:terminase small subunit-like protein
VAAESIPRGQSQRPSAEILAHVLAAMEAGQSAAQALREVKVWRAEFWRWVTYKATPAMRQRYKNAVAARAHCMVDETIDIADQAKNRDEVLAAKIQIEARWRAASKFDRDSFGEAPLSECSQGSADGALIDDSLLKRLQDRDEELLLDQKALAGRPSRARGHIC